MPAYNFKREFAADVKAGRKRQTIRQKRKRRTRAGETLYLYTGQRTKRCRLLGAWTCRKISGIIIRRNEIILEQVVASGFCGSQIKETKMMVESPEANRFSRADGFNGSRQLIAWFESMYGLPFRGVVIRW